MKLIDKLHLMYTEAKRARELVSGDWDKANDLMRGIGQLPHGRPPHKPDAILNIIRPLIQRKCAMLTDTKPRFTVQPTRKGTGHAKAAALLDEVLNAWWDENNLDMAIVRGLLYAQTFGVMVTQTRWSVSRQDIVLDIVDPRHFYIDPWVATCEQLPEAEYVILEETPTVAEVEMRFPAAAGKVKPWSPPSDSQSPGLISRVFSPFYRRTQQATAVPRTLLRHYWLKDYTVEKLELTDTKTGETKEVTRRKYPGGRYLIWAHGDIILHDQPNPYSDLIHPFDMLDWYINLDGPWGDSEVSSVRSPQQLLNKLAEVCIENVMLMNNAIWICDKTAFPPSEGPDGWGQLTNAPGAIIKKRPGTEVRREYPTGVPSSTITLLTWLLNFVESHAGGFPEILSRGKAGNVQSGLGIEQLQMTASAMLRLNARALEGLIQRVGQKAVARVLQFYPEERLFHVYGPGNEFREVMFIRQQLREALGPEALKDLHRDFKFRVLPGSSLSLTKIQRALTALQLYMAGAIDRQALLEAVEWPDWQNILKRTMQEQMMGLEPVGVGKKGSKRGYGPLERQAKVAGRI